MSGYHILGAAAAAGGLDRSVSIRVKNALALAKRQSPLAQAASSLTSALPGIDRAGEDFIVNQTYEAVAQKIGDTLAAKGADADVRVVDSTGRVYFSATPSPSAEDEDDVWKFARTYGWGVVTGALGTLLSLLALRVLRGGR